MKRLFQICAALWCAVVFAAQAQVGGIKPGNGHPQQGYFFVGGKYVEGKTGPIMERQMYVEYRFPAKVTQKYPIVMIHGAAQTGTNFTGTPDGRKGWAEYFVEKGYAVYVVDQPTRGRSAWNESVGPLIRFSASQLEQRFTNAAQHKLWPQAALHTQWPGEGPKKGQRGDPVFDQFYASQVQYIGVNATVETLNREAGAALLDKIGPAIVMTHSQSGAMGWLTADARPDLVRALIQVEPSGPPVRDVDDVGAPDYLRDGALARPWGLSAIPMSYAPAVSDPAQLSFVRQDKADGPDLARCWLQKAPARQLPNLQKMPMAIVHGEASFHAPFEHCTVKFLQQAGVKPAWIDLGKQGIHGNGHMMMLEKNNFAIAAAIEEWTRTVK